MLSKRNLCGVFLAMSLAACAVGCKKKVVAAAPPAPAAPAPVPAPPPPPAPAIARFSAEPSSIQRGQSSTLRWEVTGTVTSVSIDNAVGAVQSAGSVSVSPAESATFTLTATGPGGSATASATVSVSAPPPAIQPAPPTVTETFEQRLSSEVQDAYFDYDQSAIRPDAIAALTQDAAALKAILDAFPNAAIVIEGHCDERGSAEYNLGLGDRRAASAKEFLEQLGVPADRLQTVSYGKERPVCTESTESCWQKNRHVHFSPGPRSTGD